MVIDPIDKTALVVVDLQTKLVPAMSDPGRVINRCALLLRGAAELNMEVIATEQYPQGLGNTTAEIATWLPENTPVVSKSSFSVFGEEEFVKEVKKKRRDTLIFCGVEAHVCVLQSVFDAINMGYRVILASDGVDSRNRDDVSTALSAARHAGALVLSCEAILFLMMKNSKHPAFKAVSKLVK